MLSVVRITHRGVGSIHSHPEEHGVMLEGSVAVFRAARTCNKKGDFGGGGIGMASLVVLMAR